MSNTVQTIQASTTNTIALDLTPTGHLPYLVDQARERAEQSETDGARGHTETTDENSLSFDRDKLIAALPEIVDEAMQAAIPHRYSPAVANQIAETMTGILTGALCPVWPTICTDTTPGHYDHFNHDHKVTDKRGQTLLDVTFTQFSDEDGDGPASISLGGMLSEDYDPSDVRAATEQVRRLLDKADAMADQVMRMQGAAVQSPAERAAVAAEAAVTTTVTTALAGLTTNPRDVAERLHTAIDDAQAVHLAGLGVDPEEAKSSEAFGTAVYAMVRAVDLAADPKSTARALRSALRMVIDEAGA